MTPVTRHFLVVSPLANPNPNPHAVPVQVCGSPSRFLNRPVISLEDSDLCPISTEPPALDGTSSSVPAGTSAPPAAPVTRGTTSTEAHRSARATRHWPRSRGDITAVQPATSAPPPNLGSIGPATERPTTTKRALTTTEVPPTQTAKVRLVTAPRTEGVGVPADRPQGGAALFCVWLFASCLLLCLLSAAIILGTSSRFLYWYWHTYRPLKAALKRGGDGVRLLLHHQRGEGPASRGGGALYRSVLFVHRDEEESSNIYRKTTQRVLSREEELEGWRDVMEECRVSVREGGRPEDRKTYSVILRQQSQGGAEELEWVLGGWGGAPGAGPGAGLGLWWDRNPS